MMDRRQFTGWMAAAAAALGLPADVLANAQEGRLASEQRDGDRPQPLPWNDLQRQVPDDNYGNATAEHRRGGTFDAVEVDLRPWNEWDEVMVVIEGRDGPGKPWRAVAGPMWLETDGRMPLGLPVLNAKDRQLRATVRGRR